MAFGITHTIGVLVKGNNQLNKSLIKAEAGLARFRKSAQATAGRVNALSSPAGIDMSKIREASGHMRGLGIQSIFAGGAIALNLGIAIKRASDFETAMTEVSTLVDTSTTDMGALTQQVRSLSSTFAEMPVDTAKSLYTTISAGFSDAGSATTVLTGAMKLAKGGMTETNIAIDGLTSILNAYGLTAERTTHVSDLMFVAMRAGKTTIGELSSSLGGVTPIASSVGVSLDQVLAATSALTLGGLKTAEATTSLKGILTAVVKGSDKSKKAAKQLGLDFTVAGIRAKGFANWLAEVGEKSGGDQAILAKLFGRVEALNGVLALTGNQAGSFARILGEMGEAAGATEVAFKKVEETFAFAFKKMRVNIFLVFEAIGNALLPVMLPLADAIGFVATKISEFGQAHPILTQIVAVFGLLTAATLLFGGAALIVGAQVVAAMAVVNISTGGLLLIVGGIITGVTLLTVAIVNMVKSAKEEGSALSKVWSFIRDSFYAMAVPIAFGLGFIVGTLTNAWRTIGDYTNEVWPLISEVITNVWTVIKAITLPASALLTGTLVTGMALIRNAFTFTWNLIAAVVKATWSIVSNIIAIGWNLISGAFKIGLQLLVGDWDGAWTTLETKAFAVWENIKAIFNTVPTFFGDLGSAFYDAGAGIINAFKDGITATWDSLKSGVIEVVDWIRSYLPDSDAKRGALSDLLASGRALMPTFAKGIQQTASSPIKAVGQAVAPLTRQLETAAPSPGLVSRAGGERLSPLPTANAGAFQASVSLETPALGRTAPGASDNSRSMVIEKGAITLQVSGETVVESLEEQLEKLLARLNAKYGSDQGIFAT